MKFNKKLVVTSLSTVLGLGIVGSITGTIAWYQYSTRGTATVVGMSAGRSGVLHLSADGDNWKTDVKTKDFFYTQASEVQTGHKTADLDFYAAGTNCYDGENWSFIDDNVYYFVNNGNWTSLHAYATKNSGVDENAAWPGQAMTLVNAEQKIYKVELDSKYEKIIFNNGEALDAGDPLKKTDDLDIPSSDNKTKHRYVYNEAPASSEWDTYIRVFYYEKPVKWNSVYMSAWSESGAEKNANFPGQKMSLYDAVENIYKVELSSTYQKVCFYDGGYYRQDNKLRPCTFGGFVGDLPAQAYGNPVSGYKKMQTWNPATSASEYFQFTIQLKAINKSGAQDQLVELPVWISQIVLEDANDRVDPTDPNSVTDSLRMHLHIDDHEHTPTNLLISNKNSNINCYGQLDVNGDNELDTASGIEFEDQSSTPITYGDYDNDTLLERSLTAVAINSVVHTDYEESKKIGTTVAQAAQPEDQEYLTITVTIWIEGWAQLGATNNKSAIWTNGTINRTIHAGIEFDISDKAFNEIQ